MVAAMAPGSVVVDLAAEQGGNCEVTRAGETVIERGVTVLGPTNLPGTVPHHASQMYARNVSTFLLHLVKDGALSVDLGDQITRETLVAQGGRIVNPRVLEALGLMRGEAASDPPGAEESGRAMARELPGSGIGGLAGGPGATAALEEEAS
jgi:NAD(P) transhydrogenase subunit alpha